MLFHGSIIITDPCYIIKSDDDWQDSEFGTQLSGFGFSSYLTVEGAGMEGKVLDSEGNLLGRFCTDSCLISVLLLDELNAYNPAWADRLNQSCYTVIPDVKGRIEWDGETLTGPGFSAK